MNMLVEDEIGMSVAEIAVEKDDILPALAALVKFVPTKPQNGALIGIHGVYRETEGLRLQATDGSVAAEILLPNVGYEGPEVLDDAPLTFLAPAKILQTLLAAYPTGQIVFEVEDTVMHIKAGKLNYNVTLIDDTGFPPIDIGNTFDWSRIVAAPTEDILSGIQAAAKTASKDTNKPNLHGVRITVTDGVASYFATDTRHMISVSKRFTGGLSSAAFTMPSEATEALSGLFNPTDPIKIVAHDQGVWIVREDLAIRSSVRAYAAKYPDMTPIFNLPQDKAAVVNREELEGTLKRMRAFIDPTNQKVTALFDGLFLNLSINSSDGKADELITISSYVVQEDGMERTFEDIPEGTALGFRLTNLADAVGSFSSESIVIRFTALNRPILIHSTDPKDTTKYLTSLIGK